MTMGKRILVTGGAGFIGWKVSELLLQQGYAVIAVDSLNNAYDVRLKEWRLGELRAYPGFEFSHLDITDRLALHTIFTSHSDKPFDAVINLAARAGVRQSLENPWVYYETNVNGTLNLLELCRGCGIKKFVLASTSSVYGEGMRPFQEGQSTDYPLSPYAASKKAAEAMCYTYHHLYGLDVTVLRYFTVYGPAGRPDMSIFRFIKWIAEGEPLVLYGDGSQERDFTFVEDIARGTILGLKSLGFEIINLGSNSPVDLKTITVLLEKILGKLAQIEYQSAQPADVPATWADISKAQALLGWKPEMALEEGLQRSVQWYLKNHHWARGIHLV